MVKIVSGSLPNQLKVAFIQQKSFLESKKKSSNPPLPHPNEVQVEPTASFDASSPQVEPTASFVGSGDENFKVVLVH